MIGRVATIGMPREEVQRGSRLIRPTKEEIRKAIREARRMRSQAFEMRIRAHESILRAIELLKQIDKAGIAPERCFLNRRPRHVQRASTLH
jgi:hypothetical protein